MLPMSSPMRRFRLEVGDIGQARSTRSVSPSSSPAAETDADHRLPMRRVAQRRGDAITGGADWGVPKRAHDASGVAPSGSNAGSPMVSASTRRAVAAPNLERCAKDPRIANNRYSVPGAKIQDRREPVRHRRPSGHAVPMFQKSPCSAQGRDANVEELRKCCSGMVHRPGQDN